MGGWPLTAAPQPVALFTRAWIEIEPIHMMSWYTFVALFTRAWIEIASDPWRKYNPQVALFTRAWIEIPLSVLMYSQYSVALFTRAWIEMGVKYKLVSKKLSRPLYEGVDWNMPMVLIKPHSV